MDTNPSVPSVGSQKDHTEQVVIKLEKHQGSMSQIQLQNFIWLTNDMYKMSVKYCYFPNHCAFAFEKSRAGTKRKKTSSVIFLLCLSINNFASCYP